MASVGRVSAVVAALVGKSLAATCGGVHCQHKFNKICVQLSDEDEGSSDPAAIDVDTTSEAAWALLLTKCPACDDDLYVMSGVSFECKAGTRFEMSAEECKAYAESVGLQFLNHEETVGVRLNFPCKSCLKPRAGTTADGVPFGNGIVPAGTVTYVPEGKCTGTAPSASTEWEQVCKNLQASPTPYTCPAAPPARLYSDMPRVVSVMATSVPAGLVAALLLVLIGARRSALGRPWDVQQIDEGSSADCPDLREPALTPRA